MKKWITAIKRFGGVRRGETYEVDAWRAEELIRIGLAVPYEATRTDTKMDSVPLNKMMPLPYNKANEYTIEPVRMAPEAEPPIEESRRNDGPSVRVVPERKNWKRR
jgi:hypothetical protein